MHVQCHGEELAELTNRRLACDACFVGVGQKHEVVLEQVVEAAVVQWLVGVARGLVHKGGEGKTLLFGFLVGHEHVRGQRERPEDPTIQHHLLVIADEFAHGHSEEGVEHGKEALVSRMILQKTVVGVVHLARVLDVLGAHSHHDHALPVRLIFAWPRRVEV